MSRSRAIRSCHVDQSMLLAFVFSKGIMGSIILLVCVCNGSIVYNRAIRPCHPSHSMPLKLVCVCVVLCLIDARCGRDGIFSTLEEHGLKRKTCAVFIPLICLFRLLYQQTCLRLLIFFSLAVKHHACADRGQVVPRVAAGALEAGRAGVLAEADYARMRRQHGETHRRPSHRPRVLLLLRRWRRPGGICLAHRRRQRVGEGVAQVCGEILEVGMGDFLFARVVFI